MVRLPHALPALAAAALLAACGSSRPVESEGDGSAHPAGFLGQHVEAALANIDSCQSCHGATYDGAFGPSCNACHQAETGVQASLSNCTFCHGDRVNAYTAADLPKAAPNSGAHPGHKVANLGCAECHPAVANLDHIDGNVPVQFGALARTGGATPAWSSPTCSSVYCHGSTLANGGGTNLEPTWVAGTVSCGACHATPPPTSPAGAPNNGHPFHVGIGVGCATCHSGGAAPPTHVNGTKDVIVAGPVTVTGWDCGTCHTALGVGN